MNLQITVNNFDLSPSMRTLIDEKISQNIEKLLHTFDDDIKRGSMHIEKDYKNDLFLVNFEMNLPKKHLIFSKTQHQLFESALVDLSNQLEKQIKKYKQDLVNYSLSS